MKFISLFKDIFTPSISQDIRLQYNLGVFELQNGNIEKAIVLFQSIASQHPSAAYNLGLIYLDGVGRLLPDYSRARKYFNIAHNNGHKKAQQTAEIIGLDNNRNLSRRDQKEWFNTSCAQYILGRQVGNLTYLLAYDIKNNVLAASTNEIYSLERFLSY